jgi:pyruvate,water dikinase
VFIHRYATVWSATATATATASVDVGPSVAVAAVGDAVAAVDDPVDDELMGGTGAVAGGAEPHAAIAPVSAVTSSNPVSRGGRRMARPPPASAHGRWDSAAVVGATTTVRHDRTSKEIRMTSSETWFGDSDVGERFPAWTRGNAADVFPDPFSPLGQSLVMRQGMCTGLRDAYIKIGALDFDEFENPPRPDLFKVFGGYPYNPLSMTRVLGARMPGATPEMIDRAFFDDRAEVPAYEHQAWHDSPKHEAKLGASMQWAMSTTSLPFLDADRELAGHLREGRPNLAELTDSALHARARAMIPYVQQMFENAMVVSSLSALGTGALGAICDGLGEPTLAIRLLAGIEVDSAAPSRAMWDLGRVAGASPVVSAAFDAGPDAVLVNLEADGGADARDFLVRFAAFLHDHGSRGQNEYDPRAPSWEVKPRGALAAIDLMRRSDDRQAPGVRNVTAVLERDRVAADVRARIAGDAATVGLFEAALTSAQLFLAGRERAKTNVVRVINEARVALYEYGRRLVERGVIAEVEQVFMVTDAELDSLRAEPETFTHVIVDRWQQYRRLFDYEPVFVVDGRVPSLTEMTKRSAKISVAAEPGAVLRGAAGSGGVATGRARVVFDAGDPAGLEPGDVLIAPQTDPSWVPLMVPAAAVVVNVGAQGSHAMIVSRELGIPCVASVVDATHVIPDGAIVTVDGTAGTVTVVSLPA